MIDASARSGNLDQAERVADSLRRSIAHADSEYVVPFSTDVVMATVSSDESLRWSDSLVWVVPKFGSDQRLGLEIATRREQVVEHYEWVKAAGERDRYDLNARLATAWWVIWDSEWTGVSPFTGERVDSEAFSLHFTDGDGISGEMTSLRLTPPLDQTHRQRVELFKAYFDAAETGDVDGLMSLFSADQYAGSAVRTYFGAAPGMTFVGTLDQLRESYETFYRSARVESVAVTNWYIKDWYLFAEVRWLVELADGSRHGMCTAEVLLLGSDGGIISRLGHGTHLESLPKL